MKYDWLEKRSMRSVDQLRLWSENPRLDPEEEHVRVLDYVSDFLDEPSEKKAFLELLKSIASNGYIPSDPVVVWKNPSNDKYYVAEGNRRVLALKLLRNAASSPKSIRTIVKSLAKLIDLNEISKIKVAVAPTFEECIWYINQRHSSTSLQRKWSRLQQQRWIAELYERYDKDILKLQEATGLTKGELDSTLRILKIRDLALTAEIFSKLDENEQNLVKSHRIPMTILERWFGHVKVKEQWGISYEEDKVLISADKKKFNNAYAQLIKLIIHRKDPSVTPTVDTRTIDIAIDEILSALPEVNNSSERASTDSELLDADDLLNEDNGTSHNGETIGAAVTEGVVETPSTVVKNNDPQRSRLIIETGELTTSNAKLDALFGELKLIPVSKYPTCVAAVLRVFLDIAVAEYFKAEHLIDKIEVHMNNSKKFKDIELNSRLEFLKKTNLKNKAEALKVIKKLQNNANEYSLDTLNNYVHGHKTHLTSKVYLNGFWDFLYPLFEEILDIKQ